MNVLLEGHVCTNILSYSSFEYLFTGTVCRAWKENAKSVHTDVAAAFESPSRIKEAVENGISCQCTDKRDKPTCDFFMEYAEVVDADVSVFRTLHELGYGWGDFTMQNAAIGHKLEIIKFMFEHGCPLNTSVLFNAVKANSLEIVRFLAKNNCPIDETPIETEDEESSNYRLRSFEVAIANNYIDIVRCLRSSMNFPFGTHTFKVACNADYPQNLHTLAYLHSEGCAPSSFLFYEMINDGNFHAVKFMLRHGLHENKNSTAMCIAVTRFQANIMRLLVDYNFEVNNDVVDFATYDMGLVQWLIRAGGGNKCRLTSRAYINTIEHDMNETECIEALNWLLHYWQLDIGFESFEQLVQNQRWSQALYERDDSIADWFKDHLR